MTTSVLTSSTALTRAWRNLTQTDPFLGPSVWLMLLDSRHRPVHPVIELEDAARAPAGDEVGVLVEFLAELVELAADVGHGPCRLAVLRSRPGGGLPDADDHGWLEALQDAATAAGIELVGAHFADDEHLLPVTTHQSHPVREHQSHPVREHQSHPARTRGGTGAGSQGA